MSNKQNPVILHFFYADLFTEAGFALLVLLVVLLAGWTQRIQRQRAADPAVFESTAPHQPPSVLGRSVLRIGLGALWILDGLLQAQPAMTNAFLSNVISPLVSGQPSWEASLLRFGIAVWSRHPIGYDLLSVWLQIGLGFAILAGKDRWWGRLGLWLSILWSAAIWAFGEGLGGLAAGSATWLAGSPGSAVFYGVGAGLLLLPVRAWTEGFVRRYAQRGLGVLWLVLAAFQAWPPAGYWTPEGLAGGVLSMAQMGQPPVFSAPLFAFAGLLQAHPVLWNGAFVLIMAGLGAAWLFTPRSRWIAPATLAWIGAIWWLGQDFGVLGGTGTDPNSGPPLALLVVVMMLSPRGQTGTSQSADSSGKPRKKPRGRTISMSIMVGLAVIAGGVGLYRLHQSNAESQSQQAALLDGGLTPIGNRAAPGFTLVNQDGRRVSMADFRGKAVVLTFLDPVCYDTCPVIANELAQADKILGARASQVELVAVCANPVFHSVRDIQAFDQEHGLTGVSNWQYLTSPSLGALKRVWSEYFVYVKAPKVGMVDHTQVIYFISPSGEEMWLSGNSGSATLTQSYTSLIAAYAQKSLIAA